MREDSCDCRDGCCGHFLLPKAEVHLDAVTYGPVPVPFPSADGLDVPSVISLLGQGI